MNFQIYDSTVCYFEYQYKKDFKQNNFITLGKNDGFNFIPIKKTKNDSLLLYIRSYSDNLLSIIKIIQEKVIEISSDYNSTILGPKILFLDYYKFNKLNSFGVESNQSFYFYDQKISNKVSTISIDFKNIFISKINEATPHLFKRLFIYLNEASNYYFQIKRFNCSIINTLLPYYPPAYQYFHLFQGKIHPKIYIFILKKNVLFLHQFLEIMILFL